jgi:hypothetical protein
MLARYQMVRGKPPAGYQLPGGIRQDTRKHTRHCLRPPAEVVAAYLAEPTDAAWRIFEAEYLQAIHERYAADPAPFDQLAELARQADVYLGCSCPTAANPDVRHCHTMLALRFMQEHYADLKVVLPA